MVVGYKITGRDFESGLILVGMLEDALERIAKKYPGQEFGLEIVTDI